MHEPESLPVSVVDLPHWRVNFRPLKYDAERISSPSACLDLIERTKVRLRGWDYPHLSNRTNQRERRQNWVASWSDFLGHVEYWRFYQSGQFLHLFAIREMTETAWRSRLEAATRSHLELTDITFPSIRGFIDMINFLYSMTEIFEFAARLTQAGVYDGSVTITIELKRIQGFVLTADWDRGWDIEFVVTDENLGHSWTLATDVLIADAATHSLQAVVWFFERLGWTHPSVEILRRDQEAFLSGRR